MTQKKCFYPADILIPKTDLNKWAVIACDQYTSEPEYWEDVKEYVKDTPSAINCIFPEVYLGEDNGKRIDAINGAMKNYLDNGIFSLIKDSFMYIERTDSHGAVRKGLIGKIDLEDYDFTAGSNSAVRATEQTVLSRIPPRVKIRENAPLELPHVMLLVDDPDDTLIGPLSENSDNFEKLYDFDLMKNGGHLKGFKVTANSAVGIDLALENLSENHDGLLFCVGDGNHSLATAKRCYEMNKTKLSRYALVEIVNIHSKALDFEPIYRVIFGVEPQKIIDEFVEYCGGESTSANAKKYTCVFAGDERNIAVNSPEKLAVATLQQFIDKYIEKNPDVTVDYIHGEESLKKLSRKSRAVGFLFDGMKKQELFTAVAADGSLPRKTFSMGHADDKRFYVEARKIK